jgi:hypothetical protein
MLLPDPIYRARLLKLPFKPAEAIFQACQSYPSRIPKHSSNAAGARFRTPQTIFPPSLLAISEEIVAPFSGMFS